MTLGQLSNIKILVVDDSRDNRVLLEIILKAEGAVLDFAENGNEAFEKASKHEYDIILLDIQLPGLDGFEVLTKLKSEYYNKPIIALTAHAMLEEKHKALDAGFTDHVTKPIDRSVLIKSILLHLKN